MADTSPSQRECPFYYTELTRDQQVIWDYAFQSGYLAGHEAGWEQADAHAAALYQRARRIALSLADWPVQSELPDERIEKIPTAEEQVAAAEAQRYLDKVS